MAHQSWWEKSRVHQFIQALGAYVVSIVQGTGTTVDNTDPFNPIVSAKLSTDPNNNLGLGSDSGLFATVASGEGSGSASTSLVLDDTWYGTGASVSLAAGTYLACASCHGSMTVSAGTGAIIGRLYDATAGAAITGSQFCVIRSDFVGESQATGSIQKLVTVATTSTIRIEAQRASGATYTVSTTLSDTSGQTSITYVRLY